MKINKTILAGAATIAVILCIVLAISYLKKDKPVEQKPEETVEEQEEKDTLTSKEEVAGEENADGTFTDENGFVTEGTTLVGYVGEGGNVTVPSYVTEIAAGAFLSIDSISSIMIPSTVVTMEDGAIGGGKKEESADSATGAEQEGAVEGHMPEATSAEGEESQGNAVEGSPSKEAQGNTVEGTGSTSGEEPVNVVTPDISVGGEGEEQESAPTKPTFTSDMANSGFIIYGRADSEAERYAMMNHYTFVIK